MDVALGDAEVVARVPDGRRQEKRVRVGKAHVLRRKAYAPPRDVEGVLASLQHPRKPVDRRVRVGVAHRLVQYIDKIPDPIKSRFNVIVIDPLNNEEEQYLFNGYLERIKYILDYFKITYSEDDIISFVKSSFPDMRALLTKIQQLYNRGCKELTKDMLANSYDCSELFKLIINTPDPVGNYKQMVAEWSTKPEEAILAIGKDFPDYIMTVKPELVNKLPYILINTAEYNAMLSQSIDKFVTLLGLVFKLQVIINQC